MPPEYFRTPKGDPARQVLQRVVERGPDGAEALYLRREGEAVSTAAYVNLFHARRWRELTGLENFALELSAQEPGLVEIFGLDGGNAFPPREPTAVRLGGPSRLAVPLGGRDFHYFDWKPDRPGAPFPLAVYTAERRPEMNPVRLALTVVTFERIKEAESLAAAYLEARRAHPEIRDLTGLLIVNNQPADAPRLARLNADGLRVVTSPRNTGGAGGFGLGARLAASDGGWTHVLFMDDDVSLHSEAWLRTLSLLANMKNEHRGQIVGGGMFTLERPTFCHTLSEALDHRGYPRNLVGRLDLSVPSATLAALAESPGGERDRTETGLQPYAAWWYCVIPQEIFSEHGYPLPVFFRGDDQEFGLRIGRKVLTLNGIFVWHPDFEHKRGPLRDYLGPRNWAIYTTLHFPRWRTRIILDLARRLARFLADNDYQGAALLLTAFDDYLDFHRLQDDGPAIFEKIENPRLAGLNLTRPFNPSEDVDRPDYPQGHQLYSAALVILTFGGALIPGFLFRRKPVLAARPHLRGKFPARRTVLLHESTEVKIFQRGRAFRVTAAFFRRAARFMLRHNVRRDIMNTFFPDGFSSPTSAGPED